MQRGALECMWNFAPEKSLHDESGYYEGSRFGLQVMQTKSEETGPILCQILKINIFDI